MTDHRTDGRGSGDAVFARTLRALQDEGANVLVTGAVPGKIHDRACSAFLGDGGDDHRRAFALAGRREGTIERRLPAGANRDADHLQVLSGDSAVRGATTRETGPPTESAGPTSTVGPDGPDGPDGPGVGVESTPGRETVPNDLDAIRESLTESLSTLSSAAGDPDPGEIRVCVDSLGHLFDTHDRGDVVTFCYAATALVDEVDGIGHFHLPTTADDGRVATLEPVFDLVVELGLQDGAPRQRWRTRDGTTTDWLPVDVGV